MSQASLKFKESMIDFLSTLTELPVAWYESRPEGLDHRTTKAALARYSSHCSLINSFPNGRALCEADQNKRATESFRPGAPTRRICHAGLYNEYLQIPVNGTIRAVIEFGELRGLDPDEHRDSMNHHGAAAQALQLSVEQRSELATHLSRSGHRAPADLTRYRTLITSLAAWYYQLVDESEAVSFGVERVTHEIQTRLQDVMARAENLARFAEVLTGPEVGSHATGLLASTRAFDTIIQTLGDYLQEYRFEPWHLEALLNNSRRVYLAEADEKRIDVQLDFSGHQRPVPASKAHLQHALNNLVHNAIKYSFEGTSNRRRRVKISGRSAEDGYVVTISNYGVGILPGEISSGDLFINGYRGKLTHGEYRTGAGKGLYFVKQVVENHNGKIDIKSTVVTDEATTGQPYLTKIFLTLPYVRPKE